MTAALAGSADSAELQAEIVAAVRAFVDKDVVPVASDLEHADEFPTALVATMTAMGLFGTTIPEEYGGLGLGLDTYALIQMELARGWVTLPGIMNGSFIAATMIRLHGTEEQRRRLLPRLASAEIRAALSMSEPHAGSDVQAIRTTARRDGDEYVLDGQKMWVTNAWRAGLIAVLAKTDPTTDPPHLGMTGFLVEKEPEGEAPGLTIPMPPLRKLGYKGVETTEVVFDGFRTPAASVLGGEAGVGQGFKYFMSGIEVGRVNVAARGAGLARAALDDAIGYAPRARGLRQADRAPPGDPVDDREDGHARRGGTAARAPGGAGEGTRRARRPRGGHGEVLRHRGGPGERARLHARPRRLRLLARVPAGALLPRRAVAADR